MTNKSRRGPRPERVGVPNPHINQMIVAEGQWYDGLTDREIEFLRNYAENGRNGKQAVLSCEGYNVSEAAASQMASDILSRPRVKAAKDKIMAEKFGTAHMCALRLIDEMTLCATHDPKDMFGDDGKTFLNIADMPEAVRKSIESFELVVCKDDQDDEERVLYVRKVRLASKKNFQEMLGKTYAMFSEKKILEGGDRPIGINSLVATRDVNERINLLAGMDPAEASRLADPDPGEKEITAQDKDILGLLL